MKVTTWGINEKMKINLIQPMGGAGTRFFDDGFACPKPLIDLNGKPFFYWATQSVRRHAELESLVFVVLREHVEGFGIDREVLRHFPEAKIVVLEKVLNGAALTCLEGVKAIANDLPVLFNDCDHMFRSRAFEAFVTDDGAADGALLTFRSGEPNYSYVQYGEDGGIRRTAEKQVLSNDAICGAYYFRSAAVFAEAVEEYLNSCGYGEYYLSGIYNVMAWRGMKLLGFPTDFHVSFGTPAEYEAAKRSPYLQSGGSDHLHVNDDVTILRDCSSSSNAATLLCLKGRRKVYRKYAFGADGKKLAEQLRWLQTHAGLLPLAEIAGETVTEDCCCFDMPAVEGAADFFEFLHSVPLAQSNALIERIFTTLDTTLHQVNRRGCDLPTIDRYIAEKVIKNLEIIRGAKGAVGALAGYGTITVNGVEYDNLPKLSRYLEAPHLREVFRHDEYACIHGDMTVENVIAAGTAPGYYLIDPNTGNVHDSPFLDYAKFLQSVHGGYEFLMRTREVEVSGNQINYAGGVSPEYAGIYENLGRFLAARFSERQLRSIYWHEVVHWLRLLPYKIEKTGERAALFYAGLIRVLNDVADRFEKGQAQ